MKRVIPVLAFTLCCQLTYSQNSDSTKTSQISTADSVDVNEISIYTNVDTAASFPGGKSAWIKYVEKRLDASVGLRNGAPLGKYYVVVQFVVMKDGTLKDFHPETNFGHGMEGEVIRVLKLSPKWVPAKKNNLKVNSVVRQSIMFAAQ